MKKDNLIPGHSASLHRTVKLKGPLQLAPPNLGTGLLHFRVLVRVPMPQVRVQSPNDVHLPKPPSTEKLRGFDRY